MTTFIAAGFAVLSSTIVVLAEVLVLLGGVPGG
jgi:hypothetical protein